MVVVQLIVREKEAVDTKGSDKELADSRVAKNLIVDNLHRALYVTFLVYLSLCNILVLGGEDPQVVVSQLDLVYSLFG